LNRLAAVDLAELRVDTESFLGQAVALGMRYGKLQDGYADGLRLFLQAAGTTYARRYRTGIAVDREALAEGVRQAMASLELGLVDAASGDLNEAVALLEGGKLEPLRLRGYEIAWRRLQEMQEGSGKLLGRRELSLLGPAWRDLRRWTGIVPDAWRVPVSEDEDEPAEVDPIGDFESYEQITGRLEFLSSLPEPVLKGLQASGGDVTFEEVLRRIIPPLALGRERLGDEKSDLAEFRSTCCTAGDIRPEVKAEVMGLLDRFLDTSVPCDRVREEIREAFSIELTDLEHEIGAGPADVEEKFPSVPL
jgi:hypothetical protein